MENNYTNWLVPLNIALQLKGVGFDEICVCYGRIVYNKISNKKYIPYVSHNFYSKLKGIKNSEHINDDITFGISIPTWEQVFAWFRELAEIYYTESLEEIEKLENKQPY